MLKTPMGRFRAVSFAEGVSFLVLLGIAMPLKYLAGKPEAVLVVGWIHGILFILYVITLFQAWRVRNWSKLTAGLGFLASLLPFGPFVFDAYACRDGTDSPETGAPEEG